MSKKENMNFVDKAKDFLSYSADNSDRKSDTKINKKTKSNYGSDYAVDSTSPSIFKRVKGFFTGSSGVAIDTTTSLKRNWNDKWPKYMNNYQDVYEKVSIVRKCINLLSDFAVSIGFDVDTDNDELKEEIEKMWKRTNFAEVVKKAIKKREIWGNAAFQISKDQTGDIVDFVPLDPQRLEVKIDSNTMQIDHFKYTLPSSGTEKKLDPKDVFYVSLDSLDARKTGISSLESIKTTINMKWNLQKDLEQASKRLWAPYTIFKYNTSYVKDKEQQKKEIRRFISKIKPGKTIVHNQQVDPNIINMTPDIKALIEAIKNADEEIIGNWGIPKTLLSRETESQSSLEFAIQTLYEGPVKSIQQYFEHEIEKQIYSQIAEKLGLTNSKINHMWKATHFKDSPTIRALTYAVKEGVISPRDMISMLGWNVFNIPDADDDKKKRDRLPTDERPVSMGELKKILGDKNFEDSIDGDK